MNHFNYQRNAEIITSLQARIKELEQQVEFEMNEKAKARKQRGEVTKNQAVRDLEMQAKGLSDYANQEISGLDADNIHWMNAKAALLICRANQLKEQSQ